MYDVVIVGAGPGGIFTAYELLEKRPDLSIAVFEMGNELTKRHCPIDGDKVKSCIHCKNCSIMSGFGGAGAFSDVYANAPLIGFLYGRTADLDDTKNSETGQVYNQNVMGDRVIYSGDELQYNFWLIMLLDANYEPDEEKRIDKAFRHYGQDPADEERFDSYVRGGIDVLYEKLVEGENTPEAFANRLYEFIDEFNDRFNSEISTDDILQLCVNKS